MNSTDTELTIDDTIKQLANQLNIPYEQRGDFRNSILNLKRDTIRKEFLAIAELDLRGEFEGNTWLEGIEKTSSGWNVTLADGTKLSVWVNVTLPTSQT